jgi:hypothetical protein
MDDKGITGIESWDGLKKTKSDVFKPIRVHWDKVGAGGHFKRFDKNYTIQVLSDVDDVYSSESDFLPPNSQKK